MVVIRRASSEHVEGISRVCSEGCLDTYKRFSSYCLVVEDSYNRKEAQFTNLSLFFVRGQ